MSVWAYLSVWAPTYTTLYVWAPPCTARLKGLSWSLFGGARPGASPPEGAGSMDDVCAWASPVHGRGLCMNMVICMEHATAAVACSAALCAASAEDAYGARRTCQVPRHYLFFARTPRQQLCQACASLRCRGALGLQLGCPSDTKACAGFRRRI
eukprot:333374-Chlamydomonas_euryale.AAC.4